MSAAHLIRAIPAVMLQLTVQPVCIWRNWA